MGESDNVPTLVEYLAAYTGTRWDDADRDAIDGLLPNTDADTSDRWFDYPIAGAPAVLLHLANDIGTDVVRVRVEDNLTDVFAARFEILIDVL